MGRRRDEAGAMADGLRCAVGVSELPASREAARAAALQAADRLGGPADLAVVFFSMHHAESAGEWVADLAERTHARNLIGCTAEAVAAGAKEYENGPALAVWLARLPGVELHAMHLNARRTHEGGALEGWADGLPTDWPAGAAMLVLGEPFTFPADYLLARMNEDRPGVPLFGGMASGGSAPGQHRLLFGREVVDAGAVAVWMAGNLRVRGVVSQGCKPIGRPFVVTKAEGTVLQQLGGRPALAALQEVFAALDPADQALVRRGLHLGIAVDERRETFGRGDFLVRNVVGVEPEEGFVEVGDVMRVGRTVQFMVRDAASADEDLNELLSARGGQPAGTLLFSCNGRGTRLFPQPHHDAGLVAERTGGAPLAGLFAMGEIGPVGGRNFLHGFTASVALFEPVDGGTP